MFHSQHKQRSFGFITACILAACAIGVLGFLIGRQTSGSPAVSVATNGSVQGIGQTPPPEVVSGNVDFREFWDLWQLLKDKYYQQPLSDKNLFYGAMQGLAASVGDPYTTYFEPKSAAEFTQTLSGKFEGIGAEIGIKNDQLQIVAPLPDTPAEKAGLLAGDVILKINASSTDGMSVDEAVNYIRGPKGTKVNLTVVHPKTKKPPVEVSIVRDEIQIKSVTVKMLPGKIALVTVSHFNSDTQSGFNQAVQTVLSNDAKGVILDLRNNPGGFLDTALSMAGEWVGDGVVVKERRQGKIVETLHGTGANRLHGLPTIVLVNEGSASASEIVAGALQDDGDAKLVGMKTFGKGSVQDYMNFNDGSGIKITIAEWLTPKERAINKVGLDPDVVVDRTLDDYEAQRDPQLDRAVALLNGTATTTTGGTTK